MRCATSISGTSFDDAWSSHMEVKLDGLSLPFIGYEELLRNKQATGRSKDAVDADYLERRRNR